MVEWGKAEPMDWGAQGGAWKEAAATQALAGGRVLLTCLQSLHRET